MRIYIEKLTFWSFWGELVWSLLKIRKTYGKTLHLSYIESTPLTLFSLRWLGKFLRWKVSPLVFELMNIREEGTNDLIRLCIPWNYMWGIKQQLEDEYPEIFQRVYEEPALGMYLKKSLLSPSILSPGSLSHAIYLFHVIHQDMKQYGNTESLFFLFKFPWCKILERYVGKMGIRLVYLNHLYPVQQPLSTVKTFKESIKVYVK